MKLSRRTLLGSAFALPWLESLGGFAHAQAMAPPRRLLLVFTSCGTLYDEWKPVGTGSSFTLGPLLAPLAPHQSDIVVVDGFDMQAAIDSPGDGHQPGIGGLWTGAPLLAGNQPGGAGTLSGWASAASVDQLIAQALMPHTLLPTLELGVKSDATDNHGRMIYAAANTPIAPENSPQLAFTRLFGSGGSDPSTLVARRTKVIDVVKAQVQRVKPRVGSADRVKLEQHLAALDSIEASLALQGGGLSCTPPAAPAVDAAPPGVPYYLLDAEYPTVAQQQMALAVAAFTCDLTRIASIQFDHSQGDTVFSFLGQDVGHHDLSHTDPSDMVSRQKLRDINLWYAQRFADLLAALKAVPEGNGTLLDNTLVVWGNELQDGRFHDHHHVPFVLAGKCGGALQTGRVLTASGPHNPLLVSIAQAMQTSLNQVGPAQYGSGGLSGF